ncbi:hypothetical protein FRC00_005730, partial [Tulasnella sp. 408]
MPSPTNPASQPDSNGGEHGRDPSPVALEEARTLTPQMDEEGGAQGQQNAQADQHWTAKEVHVIPEKYAADGSPGIQYVDYRAWVDAVQYVSSDPVVILLNVVPPPVFLAALDQTVVAIALPTIVRKLGTSDGYAWVGSAYMLTSGATSPFWGVLSDLTGRKPLLFFGMTLFMAASALCGAAQSMT